MAKESTNVKGTKGVLSCYICEKPVIDQDYFDAGTDGIRHRKCGPGSKVWKTKYGQSEIGEMLERRGKKPKVATPKVKDDPTRKAIKEFCGRIKYMIYMDTTNKNINCVWSVEATINGKLIKYSKGQGNIDPDLLYKGVCNG